MVPSAFVALAALPLTANGKVDRSALPIPAIARETAAVAPRTEDERRLADIFAEVLHLPQVGIHDNFFELGGHSLLATQAVSRIRDIMHAVVPLHVFFEAPTVAELALRLGPRSASQPIPRRNGNGPYPLPIPFPLPSSACGFLISFLRKVRYTTFAPPFPFTSRWMRQSFEKSLAEIVRRHEILRTTFDAIDGQGVQIIAPPSSPALTVIDLRHKPEGEARQITGQTTRLTTTPSSETTNKTTNETANEIIRADAEYAVRSRARTAPSGDAATHQ